MGRTFGSGTALVLSIVAGLLSGALLLSVYTLSLGGMLLSYLTPLPLFVAGLTFGFPAAVVAGLAGGIMSLAGSPAHAGIYLLAFAAPVAVLVRQSLLARPAEEVGGRQGELYWYPPELLIMWLAGLAVLVVLAMLIDSFGTPGGLAGMFKARVEAVLSAVSVQPDGETSPLAQNQATALTATVERLSRLMAALVGGSWMMVMAVNGALAQGLAMRLGRALRPKPDIATIELPPGLASFVIVLGVFTILIPEPGQTLALTLLVIAGSAFFFQGLGVIHALSRKARSPGMMLGTLYAMLVVFPGLVVMVAVLGFVERWAHIRRRVGAGPSAKE